MNAEAGKGAEGKRGKGEWVLAIGAVTAIALVLAVAVGVAVENVFRAKTQLELSTKLRRADFTIGAYLGWRMARAGVPAGEMPVMVDCYWGLGYEPAHNLVRTWEAAGPTTTTTWGTLGQRLPGPAALNLGYIVGYCGWSPEDLETCWTVFVTNGLEPAPVIAWLDERGKRREP